MNIDKKALQNEFEILRGRHPDRLPNRFARHSAVAEHPHRKPPLVYIVDNDAYYAESLVAQIRASGYRACTFTAIEDLRHEMAACQAEAIIIDSDFSDGALTNADVVAHSANILLVPVIFHSVRSDTQVRLAAVRAGACHFVVKPASPHRLIALLDRLTAPSNTEYEHILLVDDDVQFSSFLAQLLETSRMRVTVSNHPVEAFASLEKYQPDLIVLDVEMPEINGIELAALIRQLDDYSHVPIVFLSADDRIQTHVAGMHRGADDFLHKTVAPDFLIQSLKARAARARTLREGRRNLQTALRDLTFMQRALDEHAIVAVTDVAGRIVYANQKFTDLSGYTLPEILGKTHRVVKSGLHPNSLYQELWDTIASGRVWHGELTNRAKDGRIYDVSTTIVPKLDESGLPEQYISIRTDITPIKALEHDLARQTERLVQAAKMEAIGHLTAGVAHDFNNLLGGILGYAELATESLARGDPAHKMQKYLTQICAAGGRARDLIAQMLVFSRLDPEMASGDVPVTRLQPAVKEIVKMLRSSIPSSIELGWQFQNEQISARIQPLHLHQILLNLAINARDAIAEYGRIDVIVACRRHCGSCDACHAPIDGDYIELAVRDTGQGIPPHLLANIFDPFFTTKDVGKGTGMGLSVVHGIVHALGGHIAVESKLGEGTTLRILLPTPGQTDVAPAQPVTEPKRDVSNGTLGGLRIMVVDDEQAIVAMLEELLSLHGAQVTAFEHSAEALAAFTRNPDAVDLVITDGTMPGLSGPDMAGAMLKIRPDVRILLCTGYSPHVDAETAAQMGLAGFMYKPLDIAMLLQWIQQQPKPGNPIRPTKPKHEPHE